MKRKHKAFTLTELLVVVVVLGVLAAVAAPKFMRVLETRKTTEAENLLLALRNEQEQRCLTSKQYATTDAALPVLASVGPSSHYDYVLQTTGAKASRKNATLGDDDYYEIRMSSYKTGELCCAGAYCAKLNKSYPTCVDAVVVDECAVAANLSACEQTPDSCACLTYAESHCECTNSCSACEFTPTSCTCPTYAAANPCECTGVCNACDNNPESCECETYAAAHPEQCPNTECENVYTEGVAAGADPVDTCPGNNIETQYTCDGSFVGTCTDVYDLESGGGGLALRTSDPFTNFRNTILLAGKSQDLSMPTVDDEVGEVLERGELIEEGRDACEAAGGIWSDGYCYSAPESPADPGEPSLPDCLTLCTSAPLLAEQQHCICQLPREDRCPEGQEWDEDLSRCVSIPVAIGYRTYYSRSVTCCANGINLSIGIGGGNDEGAEEDEDEGLCGLSCPERSQPNDSCTACVCNNVCLEGAVLDPETCLCIQDPIILEPADPEEPEEPEEPVAEELEDEKVCLINPTWHTYTDGTCGGVGLPDNFATWSIGGGFTAQMTENCGPTINCSSGQECDCTPGQSYVVGVPYECDAQSCGGGTETKFGYYCATCASVPESTPCATWSSKFGQNCQN